MHTLRDLRKALEEYGEVICAVEERKRSFDILFKKDKAAVYSIKVTRNLENITKEKGEALKKAAESLKAIPTVIAERGKENLATRVIYRRYGIPAMNLQTFLQWINGSRELNLAERGGISVVLDEDAVKKYWKELVAAAGVSRRMGFKYRKGAKVRAEKLQKIPPEILKEIRGVFKYRMKNKEKIIKIGKGPFEEAKLGRKNILISFKHTKQRVEVLEAIKEEVRGVEVKFITEE